MLLAAENYLVMEHCPNQEVLSSYLLGTLPNAEADTLSSHLLECESCLVQVQALEQADPFFAAFKDASKEAAPVAAEQAYMQAVKERVKGLAAALSTASAAEVESVSGASDTKAPADRGELAANGDLLQPGAELGEYLIQQSLGQGGMGQVFKAVHRRMKRAVAIKVLAPHLVRSPSALARFQREVEAVAQLSHPNIVTAFDAREDAGIRYLVTEFIDGDTLSARVRDHGPLPIEEAVRITRQAAEALGYAHEHGVIHRDVKPGNLMLDRQGRLKLLDLGLARNQLDDANSPGAQEPLTGSGVLMGTIDFLAPEQAQDTHNVDGRADIYGLGCTFYYLLTGQIPYPRGSTVDKLLAHRVDPLPSLSSQRPDAGAGLERIVHRMMAKAPAGRYQTMAEFVEDLDSFQPPSATLPPSSVSRSGVRRAGSTATAIEAASAIASAASTITATPLAEPRARKPRRGLWLLLALAVIGIVSITAYQIVIIRDKDGNEIARIKVPEGGKVEVQGPEVKKPDPGKGEKPPAIGSGWQPIPVGESPFDKLDPAAIPAEERFAYQPKELVAVIGSHHRRHWYPPGWVCWSPDGKWVATISGNTQTVREQQLYLWNALTRKLTMLINSVNGQHLMGCAFTPDSRRIAIAGDKDIRLYDFTSEKPGYIAWGGANGPPAISMPLGYALQFSKDGSLLAVASSPQVGKHGVYIWDITGEKPRLRHTLKSDGFAGHHLAPFDMTPDGKTFALTSNKSATVGSVLVIDLDGDVATTRLTIEKTLEKPIQPARSCAISPNGTSVAVCWANEDNVLYDVRKDPASVQSTWKQSSVDAVLARFSPDGRWLVYQRSPSLFLASTIPDGDSPYAVRKLAIPQNQAFAFAPDQSVLAIYSYADQALRFVDYSKQETPELDLTSPRSARVEPSFYTNPTYSFLSDPSGRLAVPSDSGFPHVWDLNGAAPKLLFAPAQLGVEQRSHGNRSRLLGRFPRSCGGGRFLR